MQQFAVGLENLEFYPLLGVARALTHLPLKTHSRRFSIPHSFTSAYQTPIWNDFSLNVWTKRRHTYILDFGPWKWSALNMGFVNKWPSGMQGQCFFFLSLFPVSSGTYINYQLGWENLKFLLLPKIAQALTHLPLKRLGRTNPYIGSLKTRV